MIQKIDHIAIAVSSLDTEIPRFRDILGLDFQGMETVPEQKVKVAFFRCGEVAIELLEPTSLDSPIAAFIEKRGGGLHHVAFAVDDIRRQIADFKTAGMKMLNDEPKKGAHASQIAFVHPKSLAGVLAELKEAGEED